MFAALIGVILHALLPPMIMEQWGWRVPFWIGCLIIPLLYLLRRSLAETDEFLARKQRPAIPQILRTLASNWAVVVIGLMMVTMTTVSFYLITAYTPTFGQEVLHLSSFERSCRYPVRRNLKFHLASDHGRSFRPDRASTGVDYVHSGRAFDFVPGDALVGKRTLVSPIVDGRTLAFICLWWIQRGHGGDAYRDYADGGANYRFLPGL